MAKLGVTHADHVPSLLAELELSPLTADGKKAAAAMASMWQQGNVLALLYLDTMAASKAADLCKTEVPGTGLSQVTNAPHLEGPSDILCHLACSLDIFSSIVAQGLALLCRDTISARLAAYLYRPEAADDVCMDDAGTICLVCVASIKKSQPSVLQGSVKSLFCMQGPSQSRCGCTSLRQHCLLFQQH